MSSLEPLCIATVLDATLDVLVEGNLTLRAPSVSVGVGDTTAEKTSSFNKTPANTHLSQSATTTTPPTNTSQPRTQETPSSMTSQTDATTEAASSQSNRREKAFLRSTSTTETLTEQSSSRYSGTTDPNTIPLLDINATAPDAPVPKKEIPSSDSSSSSKPMSSSDTTGLDLEDIIISLLALAEGFGESIQEQLANSLQAANLGDPISQSRISLYYKRGLEDYAKAKDYFLESTGQGHKCGQGVPQDEAKASVWLLKATINEDASSQYNIDVQKDIVKAKDYFSKSANQGHTLSQYNLGIIYGCGPGVPQDFPQAMKWFVKAANDQHASSQFRVGDL
ncbi:hypothetical protein EC991_004796 [Linnemannia zychae]|nr:hypothetical protein EC991_004796 [Linnemannia zychae]